MSNRYRPNPPADIKPRARTPISPLLDVGLSAWSRNLGWIYSEHTRGQDKRGRSDLVMDQPYQRGDVWGPERRQNLIRSLLMGIPIGSFIVNDRFAARFSTRDAGGVDYVDAPGTAVIDGKQRATTIIMWFQGGLDVPAAWFNNVYINTVRPDGMVNLHDLSDSVRRHMETGIVISVLSAQVRTLAAEEEIFTLVNYGGVPQGETD
jgi:hypothetical protein